MVSVLHRTFVHVLRVFGCSRACNNITTECQATGMSKEPKKNDEDKKEGLLGCPLQSVLWTWVFYKRGTNTTVYTTCRQDGHIVHPKKKIAKGPHTKSVYVHPHQLRLLDTPTPPPPKK